MKIENPRTILKASLACGLVALAISAPAADIIKADNGDNLTATTSWVGGVVPTAADVAVWDSTITGANTTLLDVSTNWAGMRITSAAGIVTINSNTTVQVLGLGSSGIDMSTATVDLTLNPPISNLVNQTWSIASGRTLNQNGSLFGNGRILKVGAGTLNPGALNGAFAGGLTIAEASVQTSVALNNGGASGVLGTNTLILTNNGRLRFQNGGGTGGVNYNVPLQMDGAGTISFRANSLWASPPITGSGVLTLDINNGATGPVLTPTSFTNWNGHMIVTSGSGGASLRLATGFLNHSMTNMWLELASPGVGLNRQAASATVVEIGTLSGVVGTSVNGQNARVGWRNEDSTFAGIFTGANGLTKVGTGTLTLTSNSTHAGATTVQGGKLLCITGGSFSNSAITFVTNGAVFAIQLASANGQWAVGTNLVFTAVPGATNTLEFNFVGYPASSVTAPLQVRGNVTNVGPVNVSIKGGGWALGTYPLISYSGVLGGLGSSGFVVTNLPPGILGYLTNDTANTLSLVVTNSALPLHWAVGNGNWDIAATANWKDNNGVTTTYQESAGLGFPVQLDDTASGTSPITVTLVAGVTPAGVTITNAAKNYILAGGNSIGGGTPLTKLGAGTLTIQNNNTFSGGLNLIGGVVEFTSDSNLGLSNSPIVFNGGTLRYAIGASGDFSARTVTFAAGGATIDDNGNTVTLARPLGNNGPGGFTKTGGGSLTLSGTNRYSGPTTIANGTLVLGGNTYISNSPSISLSGSATLTGTISLSTPVSQLLYGTGTIAGDLTVPASTRVTPATNGVYGILTNQGNFTVSGGTLSMDVSKTNRDEFVVSGFVTFTSGTLALNFTDTLTNGTYRLLQCSGISSGSAANLIITASGVAQPNKVFSLSESLGNEIDLVVSSFRGSNIVWLGDGIQNNWDVETSLNWTNLGLAGLQQFVSGDKVTFNDTGSTSPDISLQTLVQPGSVTVNSANNYTFAASGSGKIGGTATLTKAGTGTLTITTDDNNTGGTLVSGGVLQVGNGGAGDIGSGPVTNNALVIFNQGADRSVATISGTGSIQHQGPVQLLMLSNNTYSGSTTIGVSSRLQVGNGGAAGTLGSGIVTNDGLLAFNRTGAYTLNNGITGQGTLQKLGSGAMTLGGINDYLGNTYISNGVVKLGASEVIPNGGATTGWLILDGSASAGALDMNGFNETVNALSGTTGASLGLITNTSASVTTTNTLTIKQTASTTYAGLIADNPAGGKVAVVFDGAGGGVLSLTVNNSFSGGMTLWDGTVNATGGSPCGTGTIVMSNATYNMAGSSGTFPGNIALVVDGGSPTLISASLANAWAGAFMSTNSNCVLNIATNVSFSAQSAKQFSNYTGVVQLVPNSGILRFSASANLNNGGDNTTFVVSDGSLLQTRNAGTVTLGALTGTGRIGNMQDPASTGIATYIIGTKNQETTFSGSISGVDPQFNAIVKAGTAKLTFDGNLTYGGSTTVSNGVLAIAGTAEITNSSQINLRTAGTLDMSASVAGGLELGKTAAQALTGSGTNIGFVSVAANSAVRPGNGLGEIGNLTIVGAFTNSGTMTMELNTTNSPATNDSVTATSIRVTGGTLVVTNVGPDLVAGNSFKLFSAPVTGAFGTVTLPASNVLNTVAYTWTNKLAVDGSIAVLTASSSPSIATNATNLVFTSGGGNLTVTWPADHIGWTLQVQTNTRAAGLRTNWFNVSGSTATNQMVFPISLSEQTIFFRMTYP